MKKICVKLSGWGALLVCVPVMYQIHKGDIFNPASYFLWSALSLICSLVLIRAKEGGHTMMLGYFLSDFSVGLYASLRSGKAIFGKFEWFVIALTILCIIIYVWCELRGDAKQSDQDPKAKKVFKPAVIVNGVACMIAGLPQIADSFRDPHSISFVICGLYVVISCLAYYGEENFNGKFIPGLSLFYWFALVWGILVARTIV